MIIRGLQCYGDRKLLFTEWGSSRIRTDAEGSLLILSLAHESKLIFIIAPTILQADRGRWDFIARRRSMIGSRSMVFATETATR